ncbi:hypothetical protein SAICODRAFT_19004 [Saitoella complicata NRRL Y-17804]|uniref:uncharacterized protein n=1 Tax=Saitoella complicata (strain BCRC 22490 / CBS 7301 / JCM 7358 / NBRC 10748 / NRRL Y-17804) TaxID=698492 RepID=UPI000867674A|nr:uncharacterized protein SAICODRAFT_19004 [Saitoella complicata NRRL Y-17804]ODQ53529.1 hypothetical protein SAICODRAFT_19004 [Saitoella complicata NRRL Y-17804]
MLLSGLHGHRGRLAILASILLAFWSLSLFLRTTPSPSTIKHPQSGSLPSSDPFIEDDLELELANTPLSAIYSTLDLLLSLHLSHPPLPSSQTYLAETARLARILTSISAWPAGVDENQLGLVLEERVLGYLDTAGIERRVEGAGGAKGVLGWVWQRIGEGGRGRGVVVIVDPGRGGKGVERELEVFVKGLREGVKCTLPIEITYAGEYALSEAQRDFLREHLDITQIKFIDIFESPLFLNPRSPTGLPLKSVTSITPYAILASEFEEVVVCRPDTIFLQNPQTLFSASEYKTNGALFFHPALIKTDSTTWHERTDWIISQVGAEGVSSELSHSKFWASQADGMSTPDYVFVISKKEREMVYAVGFAGWMALPNVRDHWLHTWGGNEGEVMWLACEMMRVAYGFSSSWAGAIGVLSENGAEVCGGREVYVIKDRPVWFGGGLMKHEGRGWVGAREMAWTEGEKVEWGSGSGNGTCVGLKEGRWRDMTGGCDLVVEKMVGIAEEVYARTLA